MVGCRNVQRSSYVEIEAKQYLSATAFLFHCSQSICVKFNFHVFPSQWRNNESPYMSWLTSLLGRPIFYHGSTVCAPTLFPGFFHAPTWVNLHYRYISLKVPDMKMLKYYSGWNLHKGQFLLYLIHNGGKNDNLYLKVLIGKLCMFFVLFSVVTTFSYFQATFLLISPEVFGILTPNFTTKVRKMWLNFWYQNQEWVTGMTLWIMSGTCKGQRYLWFQPPCGGIYHVWNLFNVSTSNLPLVTQINTARHKIHISVVLFFFLFGIVYMR